MACNCGITSKTQNLCFSETRADFDLCELCSASANSVYSKFEVSFLKRPKLDIYKQDLTQHYKCSRQRQVKSLKIRANTVGEGSSDYISLQCSALVKLADLIGNYPAHPCKTVFSGLYYSAINSQDTFIENYSGDFDPDRFEETITGDFGDEESVHTEQPGVPVYVVSPFPFHRPTVLMLLLAIVEGMQQTFGCSVRVEYNCFNSARITVTRQNIFPVWEVDTTCPTIYIEEFDFRICIRTLCCPAFNFCNNWLDVADVFLLHNCFDLDVRHVVVSPDLKSVYDRSNFPLSPKCSLDTDLSYRLHWRALCSTYSQNLVTRLVFLFFNSLPNFSDCYKCYGVYCNQAVFQPLLTWNLSVKDNCQGCFTHECVVDKATSSWSDLKVCQIDCSENLELCFDGSAAQVNYIVDSHINSYQSSEICDFYKQSKTLNQNCVEVEYMWVLRKPDLFCPDPDEDCFEIDYHKMTVSSGDTWQKSFMASISDFHHKMNTVKPVCRRCYYRGDLVIFVRTILTPEAPPSKKLNSNS